MQPAFVSHTSVEHLLFLSELHLTLQLRFKFKESRL